MSDPLSEWRPAVDREIERVLPRALTQEYLRSFFGEGRYEYDAEAIEDALSVPVWDLLDRGGKRWRAVVFLMLVDGFGADPDELLPYAVIPEILHNGTIIVDDVEDEAEMRRGEEAIHRRYGQDIALNAGNALYFIPLKILERDPGDLPPETRLAVYEMLTYELNRTHLGQGMDIRWHNDDAVDITEAEYMEMSACKTGCLGRIVGRLAALVTGQSDETERALAEFMETVCIAFQISDDVLDVEHSVDPESTGEFGKAVGNDIKEGKKTLMVVHTVRNASDEDAARLTEILAADDTTDEEALEAIDIMQQYGSVEYARERALALVEESLDALHEVPVDEETRAELAAFAEYVVERDV
ncbi:polyprenyl synthetase family protein [Halarchaeum sp. P4]|uniref:polyprenyl synthetase family protein n=1 Tax=Halarchaeum sp. P4 TaxID=3421639 RepID=UPI003EBFCB36